MSGVRHTRPPASWMKVCVFISVLLVAAALPSVARAASYNTILIGHGQLAQGDKSCTPLPGAVDLFHVAQDLQARGLTATPVITTSQQAETTRGCGTLGQLYASWQDLMNLHTTYGWEDVSRGVRALNLTNATPDKVKAETCGSLPIFDQHGFHRAWGLYGYAANTGRTAANQAIVDTCFAYGRQYGAQSNPLPVPSPYWFKVYSVNGGHCVATGLPCSTLGTPYAYTSPTVLSALMNPGAGRAGAVQFYRFVSGSYGRLGQTPAWDCTSSDWKQHWTSASELYCYNDFLQVANAAQTAVAGGVINADPAAIALAQGRDMSAGQPPSPPPMVSITMSRTELSAADFSNGETKPCVRDDADVATLDGVVLPWIGQNAPNVRLTGSIETGVTQSTTEWCAHYGWSVAASWADAAALQATYGMRFVSHSSTYAQNWGSLTDQQRYNQTCGSRNVITQHGLLGADGQFDWPNNVVDAYTQTTYVVPCFYFNRVYGTDGVNTLAWSQAHNNEVSTLQMMGGGCAALNQPCSNADGIYKYVQPQTVVDEINGLQPGQHLSLQGYVFVTGTNPAYSSAGTESNTTQWDCTNPDPAYHWSNDVERYCWSDFQQVLLALEARAESTTSPIVVTDPETVAKTWGMAAPTK
jgi:hypothetical protein